MSAVRIVSMYQALIVLSLCLGLVVTNRDIPRNKEEHCREELTLIYKGDIQSTVVGSLDTVGSRVLTVDYPYLDDERYLEYVVSTIVTLLEGQTVIYSHYQNFLKDGSIFVEGTAKVGPQGNITGTQAVVGGTGKYWGATGTAEFADCNVNSGLCKFMFVIDRRCKVRL